MARAPRLAALFDRLGREVDAALIDEALTHPSASSAARPDYQRLEFLGDRVLNLVVAEALVRRRPEESEGKLAPRLNALVRKETCAEIAEEIGLGAHLRLERSESKAGGRKRLSNLGDAMEAVLGAVFLDQGFAAAQEVVLRLWRDRIETQGAAPRDAKTALQEWAQARAMPPPTYVEIARIGPDHAPVFTVEARLASGESASAQAPSKRAAEHAAAAELLARLTG
ncbi:MAG: ribonuclease III [Rubrimonas sp.]|uniref:ribonuclease III n=1 Tax=Rubrimonas sp. TaxID=2036015 RepID=UPI002FDF0A03